MRNIQGTIFMGTETRGRFSNLGFPIEFIKVFSQLSLY